MIARSKQSMRLAVLPLAVATLLAACGGGGGGGEPPPASTNRAPAISGTAIATAQAGAAYSYSVTGTDPDGDTLSYSLTTAPTGMTINAATGAISWTPTDAQVGSQSVTVSVRDAAGLAATQTFTINVAAANAAPRITSTAPTTAVVGTAFAYTVVATDPNSDTLTYSLTAAPTGMTINASTGVIAWTPAAGQVGAQSATVRVTDPAGLFTTQTFSMAVVAGAAAPQITTTAGTTGQVGVAYSYDVNATDANGDTLTYSLTAAPTGMTINATTGLISWTPAAGQNGNQQATVRVADPGGLSAVQTFTVAVAVANVAPVISTTAGLTGQVGVAYSYDVNATDANGDTLVYSLTTAPTGMTINATTGLIAWTPAAGQNGAQNVTVRVADPAGLFATQTFAINVAAANGAPVITSTAVLAAQAGVAYAYDVNATDPNGDTLTYSFVGTPPTGMTISATTGLIAWTPTAGQVGAQNVTVRAADSGGLSATQAFAITVAPPNAAPTITSTAVTTATVGAPYVYQVAATDPNGDALTYSLTTPPTGMAISTSGRITWTPAAGQTGAQAATVRVADPGGLFATQAFTVTVSPAAPATPMTMLCADGTGFQCSGDTIYRRENGVALTRSGVQVHGRSTSDTVVPNPTPATAVGLAISTAGTAEMRIQRNTATPAVPIVAAVLLRDMGIPWSGAIERPPIIETFNPTAGRVVLDAAGALSQIALPQPTDLTFYNFATLGAAGATRANYANNRYFPRTPANLRCPVGQTCTNLETTGLQFTQGTWRALGGFEPDMLRAARLHSDGDVHAGNGDAAGNPLPSGNGVGVPFPGSKGFRDMFMFSYDHANLASWLTLDTVGIAEWGGTNERNQNRRGITAFGNVTDPTLVPTTGTTTYRGVAYGHYTPNGTTDSVPIYGDVNVSVNFATRVVTVTITNAQTYDATPTPVPVNLTSTLTLSPAGNDANYMTGLANNATLTAGGMSARLFGPVVGGGAGSGPIEIGGAFSLSNAAGGAVVGGIIARKQ